MHEQARSNCRPVESQVNGVTRLNVRDLVQTFIGLPQVVVVADRSCIVIFILTLKVAATPEKGRNNHGGASSAMLARIWSIMTLCSLGDSAFAVIVIIFCCCRPSLAAIAVADRRISFYCSAKTRNIARRHDHLETAPRTRQRGHR